MFRRLSSLALSDILLGNLIMLMAQRRCYKSYEECVASIVLDEVFVNKNLSIKILFVEMLIMFGYPTFHIFNLKK